MRAGGLRVRLRFALVVLALAGLSLVVGADPVEARPSPEPFGIVPGSFEATASSREAGAHADLSISLELPHDEDGRTFNDLRTAVFDLPAGVVGNADAVPACTQAEFLAGELTPACAPASQVGTIGFEGHLGSNPVSASLPLYNLVPTEPGLPAQLGFRLASFVQLLPLRLRPDDGGLTVSALDVTAVLEQRELSIEVWGVPAVATHDPERGRRCLAMGGEPSCSGGGEAAGVPPRPFLANPTGCGPATAEVRAASWEQPGSWAVASAELGPIVECGAVPFDPALEVEATSAAAESPSGFLISLAMPTDWLDPEAKPSSALRDARILLPQGFALNPAYVAGLQEGSVVGTLVAQAPTLGEPASGKLHLGRPLENENGVHVPLHAVVETPAAGVRVQLSAKLEVDPRSGRTAVAIEDAPQLPFERLDLSFGVAGSAPLVTPEACGDFGASVELTPWSAPGAPRLPEDRVSVDRGVAGAPCGALADRPFRPRLSAASVRPRAGVYSPFSLGIAREDAEARLEDVSFWLPPGLSARLAGVGVCPESALEAAAARSARSERAAPSCQPRSRLGRTLIEAGVGAAPAQLPGSAYLAGPYAGSPLSVVLVTPALLGPFDLGTVVVREGLRVDPRSGALVIGAGEGPLPAAIDGIPLRVRSIAIQLDRPELLRNPTSCRTLATTALVEGAGGAGETRSAPLSRPYRVKHCGRLRFMPSLRLSVLGSVARNGHPGLRAVLLSHADEANLARASVSMPRDLLLDPSRIRATCGARELDSRTCPPQSIIGWARAISPLSGEPLRGHLYLRRNSHAQLPDLVADLRNRKVGVNLTQQLRMEPTGVSVVARAAPDMPISKLVLVVAGGRRGLLVNSVDLCERRERLRIRMLGQNGKSRELRTRLPGHCPARSDRTGSRAAR
jgi:hypothetical protein